MDINELNETIVNAIKQAEQANCDRTIPRSRSLNDRTKNLMRERRELQNIYDVNFLELKKLYKDITKAIRNDIK